MEKSVVRAIVTAKKPEKKISVPKGVFCSDTFLCENCGCRGIYKVYGNTKTCPECGGTMRRQ